MNSQLIDTHSTIAAISTPQGVGGIAVVRVSGDDAITISDKIWRGKSLSEAETHTARLGTVIDNEGRDLDTAVATVFREPKSFTGQNTVEFSVHGSLYVQRELIKSLVAAGARPALPGEFTRRAFINARLPLTQAEAVADLIASNSRASHALAMSQMKGSVENDTLNLRRQLVDLISLLELELDFSEEDVNFADRSQLKSIAEKIALHIKRLLESYSTGNAIKNGIPVAIVGPPNVGKSSLLNALTQNDRAIVSPIAGTTRDTVEETIEIGDYLFRFIDTAGLRKTNDPIEKMGMERSHAAASQACIVISVIDSADMETGLVGVKQISDIIKQDTNHIIAVNKIDLNNNEIHLNNANYKSQNLRIIPVSAKTGFGIDHIKQAMVEEMDRQTQQYKNATETAGIIVSNARHAEALRKALAGAEAILEAMNNELPSDLVALEAHATARALAEITGEVTDDEILGTIFSRFCIGK